MKLQKMKLKTWKTWMALGALCLAGALCLGGCGAGQEKAEKKILRSAEAFSIATLNPHVDYQGWYTSIYGVTETLFARYSQKELTPLLAESADLEGLTWTIVLKDGVKFSSGEALTAQVVIDNLKDAGNVNERFADFAEYTYEALDERTLTITTAEAVPTLLNDLSSPELAIVDLNSGGEDWNTLIATGPFTVAEFVSGGNVTVEKNDSYWNGDVMLDGGEFFYMPEADTALLAMQNGEIDAYSNITPDAASLLAEAPEEYSLTTTPATRLQFYILNMRQEEAVRKAVNLIVDASAMEPYMGGMVSPTVGPFASDAAYGQVEKPAVNVEEAKRVLEEAGYALNGNGIYEKNGQELTLNVAYYAARGLDTVAVLMQEQLAKAGIATSLSVEEDPDGTYIASGDFDIALYCMIADKAGDPYYFISTTLGENAVYNCGGYENREAWALIQELKTETDAAKRADLSNKILQKAIDDNAFGYLALFNKTTAVRTGVSGVYENCPFDFYFLNAKTDMK